MDGGKPAPEFPETVTLWGYKECSCWHFSPNIDPFMDAHVITGTIKEIKG